jgi:hypothetical protein
MKLTNFGISLIIGTLFFFYEYMFRGFQVLIKGKKLTLFPDNFYRFITRILLKTEIPYRPKREKMVAYIGVFLSGVSFVMLMFYYIGLISSAK